MIPTRTADNIGSGTLGDLTMTSERAAYAATQENR